MPQRFSFILIFLYAVNSFAQLNYSSDRFESVNEQGYILYSPITSKNVYLIDKCGNLAHSWQTACKPGQSAFLLENGDLIRAGHDLGPFYNIGGKGGLLERYDWNNNKVWSYKLSDYDNCLHHDFKVLPNGNILALVWSEVRPLSRVINMGRNPDLLGTWIYTEKIVEIQPIGKDSGNIIWEWNLFDHLIQDFDSTKSNYGIVKDHPELVNFNYVQEIVPNWIHINSIDYNVRTDQILVSTRFFSEIWIIDHSTTTAEAKGHKGGRYGKGGDLLYRWGNPRTYNRGDSTHQQLFFQHDAQWIKPGFKHEGKILVFNNGLNRPAGKFSSVDIIQPPFNHSTNAYNIDDDQAFLPDKAEWSYRDERPENFYSYFLSGVQPLKSGGYMICSGANGIFMELDSLNNKVWQYTYSPNQFETATQSDTAFINSIYKCQFYYPDFKGFSGKTFRPLKIK